MTHVKHLLADFVSGKCTPDESEQVRRHVETCRSCQTDLETIRLAEAHLSSMRAVEAPPPGYWTTLVPRVQETIGKRGAGSTRRRIVEMLGAASALAAAVIAVFVITHPFRQPAPPATGVTAEQRAELHAALSSLPDSTLMNAADSISAMPSLTFPATDLIDVSRAAGTDELPFVAEASSEDLAAAVITGGSADTAGLPQAIDMVAPEGSADPVFQVRRLVETSGLNDKEMNQLLAALGRGGR